MRLQVVEQGHLNQHHYLEHSDKCYFFDVMPPGRDNWGVPIKSLVYNLKKRPTENGYQYKAGAIRETAHYLYNAIKKDSFKRVTIVPTPPSKIDTHPEYDDRLWNVLLELKKLLKDDQVDLDMRKIIYQTENYESSHKGVDRIKLDDLEKIYAIDSNCLSPTPSLIIVFDDVLTSGCHYKAMQRILSKQFPNTEIYGIFLARVDHSNTAAQDFNVEKQ